MRKHILIPPDRYAGVERLTHRFIGYAVVLWVASVFFFYLPQAFILLTFPLSVAGFVLALRFIGNSARRELGLRRRELPVLPYPLSFRYAAAGGLLSGAAIALFYQTLSTLSGPPVPTIPVMSVLVPFLMFGAALVHIGYFSHEPAPLSCPACSYSLQGLSFPTNCPECQHAIATPDAAVSMIRVRRPLVGNIGAAITAASLLLFISFVFRPGPVLNWIPAANRIAMAPTDRKAFHSLISGNLTPADASALADAILDAVDAGERGMTAQLDWIDTQLAAGLLTDEQAVRYLFGAAEFTIVAEGRPTVGRPITLRLNTPSEWKSRSNRVRSAYFFSGFETDPPLPIEQPPTGAAWLPINDPLAASPRPAAEITPTSPGPLTIRARVILIATPYTPTAPAITWHADGTHTIAPPPLVAQQVMLETTTEVAPNK